MRYLFDDFELDASAYELRQGGKLLRLQPRVFDLLRYFAENAGRVIGHEELLSALWPGEHVSDSAMSWRVHQARKALGQRRGAQLPIETLQRRGYRFAADVRVEDSPARAQKAPSMPPPPVLPVPAVDPFVGRKATLAELTAALSRAQAGNGSLCLLLGEPGIGKTRCALELATLARSAGFVVLRAACVDDADAPSLWPFVQLLREHAEALETRGQKADAVTDLLAAIDPALRGASEASASAEPTTSFWLIDRVCRAVLGAVDALPLLLCIDDLHWADELSLRVLRMLAPELAHTRILVVATARDEGSAPRGEHESLFRQLSRVSLSLPLSGLSAEDVQQYVKEVAADGTPELALQLHARTLGNPLFVRETLRLLVSQGALGAGAAGRARAPRADAVPLPAAVRDVLAERCARLPAKTQSLLALASVLGQRFEVSVLAAAAHLPPSEALLHLDAAVVRGLVVPPSAPAGEHAFAHDLVRETLYAGIPAQERALLHRDVAQALQAQPDAAARGGELAHHFHHAVSVGHAADALRYALAAGDAAMAALSYDSAARFYGFAASADAALGQGEPRARAELLLSLATAHARAGHTAETSETVRQLVALSRARGYADLLVAAGALLRPIHMVAQVPAPLALEALQAAQKLLPEGERSLRTRALCLLSCMPPASGVMSECLRMSEEALSLARAIAEPSDLLRALTARLYALSGPDDFGPQQVVIEEILRTEPATARSWASCEAYSARHHALLMRGDGAGAERARLGFGDVATALRLPEPALLYERWRAQALFHAGKHAEASAQYARLRDRGWMIGMRYASFFYAAQMNELLLELLDLRQLAPKLDPARLRTLPAWSIATTRAVLCRLWLHAGHVSDARATLALALEQGLSSLPKNLSYVHALCCYAEVAAAQSDRAAAQALYPLLVPYEELHAVDALDLSLGSVAGFLARLSVTRGEPAAARRHFEAALASNQAAGAPAKVALVSAAYAQFLLDAGGSSELARARELTASAHAAAQAMSMQPLLLRTQQLSQRLKTSAAGRG